MRNALRPVYNVARILGKPAGIMTLRGKVAGLLIASTTLVAAQSSTTRADFDAFVEYFTSESATWQQNNVEPGKGEPTRWVRRHTSDGDTATVEVVAAYTDGRCEAVTTIHYRWSSTDQTITSEAHARMGATFSGTVEPLDGSRYRTTAEGVLPDGTEIKIRDTSDLSSPGSAVSTAERWADGAWVPLDGVTWRRVPADAWCGGGPSGF